MGQTTGGTFCPEHVVDDRPLDQPGLTLLESVEFDAIVSDVGDPARPTCGKRRETREPCLHLEGWGVCPSLSTSATNRHMNTDNVSHLTADHRRNLMPTPDDAPEVKAHAQDPAMTTGEGKSFRYKSPITVTHPKVAAQWARSLNGQLTPDQVTAGSGRKVWWRCKRRHEWVACVSSRTGGSGCPTCAGFYSKPLSTTHPELAAQWHPTRNGNLTPDKVTAGSARRVWWLCEKIGRAHV